MYIHELENWPQFFWNQESVLAMLARVRFQQGKLIGSMEAIGFNYRQESILYTLTQDVVKSSEIEGELLDHASVRSSVARHLRIEIAGSAPKDKHVEGVVAMIMDATQKFDQELTQERLLRWHATLFSSGLSGLSKIRTGNWRHGPVDVVSGRVGREIVHFQAPPAALVSSQMTTFLHWFNESEPEQDLLIKAAIAHLWFVTVHPFDDGNGRIGRAIADLMLARAESSSRRFYSLSAQIQKERSDYYTVLETTQKGNLDITRWILWFLSCLERSIDEALSSLNIVLQKTQFWETHANIPFNERQRKIIQLLLSDFEGKLTTSKWAKITKCSQDTAYRDILDLIEKKILKKSESAGRATSYALQE